ncbi:MAG: hypothetical protein HXY20_02195, partial [Acidobacteria bacterium]|nr:hypothetical protein [Acidobacteriota bacterium]
QNTPPGGARAVGREADGRSTPDEGPQPRDLRSLAGNPAGLPPSTGGHGDEDLRQLRREFQQRVTDAEELRRLMNRSASQLPTLNQIIDMLRRMGDYGDPEEVARLRGAVDLLRQMELALGRELGRLAEKEQLLYPGGSEVPRGFERLVEEYYKALARALPKQ